MEEVTIGAAVVSALAALGALRYARDTFHEARQLRREERLARVPELVSHVAEMARRVRDHHSAPSELRIAQARLRTAIVASGERLPLISAR